MLIYRTKSIEDLGKRLKKIRKAKGVSINELARRYCLTASTVSRLERGMINPKLSTLVRLSLAFEMSISEIMKGIEYAEEVDDSWDKWGPW